MFGRLGGTELMVILVVGFLIFGPKKLPEIGKSFGETIREFKKSAKDAENEVIEAKVEESK
ncbi:twin-arginine translocase TatA/TatE family subunit [Tepidibacter aestuarii]|uniref:twin-arginine translocase TatA/TatE family subunit n=1 Tax=Tepidibacter aestuarii TaxID=2925782 RepID=UPI0020BDB285|nr:twin-arginine translocase TatA/TatE family subunit [Tepidibacter aestuarii]CAH2213411.1 Sec-independent protein translocase protein TatA [Tepidibacter aestuarii]